MTCFQETAEALLGHSAETLGQLRDTVRHSNTHRYTFGPLFFFCSCEDLFLHNAFSALTLTITNRILILTLKPSLNLLAENVEEEISSQFLLN